MKKFLCVALVCIITPLMWTSAAYANDTLNVEAVNASEAEIHEVTKIGVAVTTTREAIDASDFRGHWGEEAILWGVHNRIMTGYPDGTFRPNSHVTVAEFLAILVRTYEEIENGKEGAPWYNPYTEYAEKRDWGVTSLPNDKIVRGEVAVILAKSSGYNTKNVDEAIQYLFNNEIAQGKTTATIDGFGKDDVLTRAEAITFIQNYRAKVDVFRSGDGLIQSNRYLNLSEKIANILEETEYKSQLTRMVGADVILVETDKDLVASVVPYSMGGFETVIQGQHYTELDSVRTKFVEIILGHAELSDPSIALSEVNNLTFREEKVFDSDTHKVAIFTPDGQTLAVRVTLK